jgi:hypothetical protein
LRYNEEYLSRATAIEECKVSEHFRGFEMPAKPLINTNDPIINFDRVGSSLLTNGTTAQRLETALAKVD